MIVRTIINQFLAPDLPSVGNRVSSIKPRLWGWGEAITQIATLAMPLSVMAATFATINAYDHDERRITYTNERAIDAGAFRTVYSARLEPSHPFCPFGSTLPG